MKVTIEIGLPGAYLDTLDKDDIKELGDMLRNEYAGILAVMGIDNDGIDVDIKETEDGGFYARLNRATVPADDDGVEEEDESDEEEVDDEVDDILPTDDWEPCCDCGCCSSWEKCADTTEDRLTTAECNTALLKLYLMLSYNCGEELHHEHGMSVLDPREKAYLLKRLFTDTGLDSIARDVSKALGREH